MLTYEPIVNWRKIFRKNFTVPEPKNKTNANLNVCTIFIDNTVSFIINFAVWVKQGLQEISYFDTA